MNRPNVTIGWDEYTFLLERLSFLRHLERCGLENWDGYELAYKTFHVKELENTEE